MEPSFLHRQQRIHPKAELRPAPEKKLKGKIIDVVEKGFKLGDKIIRHPKVVVGN